MYSKRERMRVYVCVCGIIVFVLRCVTMDLQIVSFFVSSCSIGNYIIIIIR